MAELSVRVPGMTSRQCVRAVSAQVSDVPGVLAVAVDLGTGTVLVLGRVDPAAVRAAIAAAGYEVAE